MLGFAVLAGSAAAQNNQGLKGHYVILSATKIVDNLTPSTAILTVSGSVSFSVAERKWSQSLSASNTIPPNPGTSYNGDAQHRVQYTIRVKWVPDLDNPPDLKPQGQDGQWTGDESTAVSLGPVFGTGPGGGGGSGFWGQVNTSTSTSGQFVAYNHVGMSTPSTAMNVTLSSPSNISQTRSGSFTDMVDGGFTFSAQPEGWIGSGTFEHINATNWTTSCGSAAKSNGSGSASVNRTLTKIGGLLVIQPVGQ